MKANLYGIGKGIIAKCMSVNYWWVDEYNFPQLLKAFGMQSLRNGVQNSLDKGEEVPQEIRELVGL